MSKKTKHIDQIARQKLLNASVEPPISAWDQIAKDLDQKRSRKRIVLFRRIVSTAAVMVILLSVGLVFLNPFTKNEESVSTNKKPIESTIKEETIQERFTPNTDSSYKPITLPITIIAQAKNIKTPVNIAKAGMGFAFMQYIRTINPIKTDQGLSSLIAENKLFKQSTHEFNWEQYKIPTETDISDESQRNWKVGLGLSPSYASMSSSNNAGISDEYTPGSGSNTDIVDATENIMPSLTLGVNISYNLSERWSLVSGLSYLRQKNEIRNFYVLERSAMFENNYSTNSNLGNIQLSNSGVIYDNAVINNQVEVGDDSSVYNFSSDLIQNFEFLEIPLLISYKLIDTKWSVSLISGFNAGILVGNAVYLKGNESEKVGSTEDINKFSLKSVIGFSIDYPLSKRFFISIAPSYQYQLNKFNKASVQKYHLQFLDIKTGISYRF